MTEIERLSYNVLNSGVLRQNYDVNDLARSCRCSYELTGFKALQLAVIPECHRNNIRLLY
ncbi:27903_t:CDS:2 [Gigaspora margarita]|uniref:27903_t:CDS:1 n=1 Tax=Gigaspora margarita TaxID=4874 RepID=A0ABN7UEV2_GIGMA|nr:27903_t:CDS:2 [Gigaspora margarita]